MQELYIDTDEDLEALCEHLSTADWITLDTEFVREKTYYPKLCLLQLHDGNIAACIDPLSIDSLKPLVDLLHNSACEKVFHAASQDLEIFTHEWGLLPTPLFDTQLAASILGLGDQIGYASLVNKLLGHQLGKTHTRTDWAQRPLSDAQRRYALDDVIYLGDIYLLLKQKLEDAGRSQWLSEDFSLLANPASYQVDPQECWKKVKGKQHLKGVSLAILQSLSAWREQQAQKANRPKRWILKDDVLIDLSKRKPKTLEQLQHIRGVEPGTTKRHGELLLSLIETAQTLPQEAWPTLQDRPPTLSKNQDAMVDLLSCALRLAADTHSITPASLATRKELEKLVAGDRDIELLKGWRHQVAGKSLVQVLEGDLVPQFKKDKLVLAPQSTAPE